MLCMFSSEKLNFLLKQYLPNSIVVQYWRAMKATYIDGNSKYFV